jgi:hypothetical protein
MALSILSILGGNSSLDSKAPLGDKSLLNNLLGTVIPGENKTEGFLNLLSEASERTGPQTPGGGPYGPVKFGDLLKFLGRKPQTATSAATPPPPTADQLKIAELTKAAQDYRAQADEQIKAAEAKIAELSNEDLQRQKAAELQNRLAIQAQSSAARGGMAPNLRISPGSQTSKTAGTQAFRRRADQFQTTPIQSSAGVNVPTASVLNI